MRQLWMVLALGFLLAAAPAFGAVTIVQGASAPTYDVTLNFDEPGGPVGVGIPTDAWLASHGITEMLAGDGQNVVDDLSGFFPWVNDGNAFFGNFGVFMKFENDLTEMSLDAWDPSGPPSPFGGGLGVFLFNDGGDDPIATGFFTPAWGGLGDQAFNITTSEGTVFDEIRILGFGFGPTTIVDNLSWNVVPEPGTLTLFALGAAAVLRRRQS